MDRRRQGSRYVSAANLQRHDNMCVSKVGRTSGYTAGHIHRIDPSITIPYDMVGSGGNNYTIEVKGKVLVVATVPYGGPFARQGDWGALVLNDQTRGVGTVLGMCGSATYISPIGPNLDHMREVVRRGVEGVEIEYL